MEHKVNTKKEIQNYEDGKNNETVQSHDIEQFLDGNLAIEIRSSEEYVEFIKLLTKRGCFLINDVEYPAEPDYYDPKYPYYYMEDPDDLYMNANMDMDNLIKYEHISECKRFMELDFMQNRADNEACTKR